MPRFWAKYGGGDESSRSLEKNGRLSVGKKLVGRKVSSRSATKWSAVGGMIGIGHFLLG